MTQPMDNALLDAQEIEFAYNGRAVLYGVNLALRAGDLVALLGPNGSGKTTLLKILCGILPPRVGRVTLDERQLSALRRRDIAQRIALVPQELTVPFAFTVREVVSLGRTPHIRLLLGEMRRDRDAVERALELTATRALDERYFADLSGGERQRVVIAMALAQVLSDPKGLAPVLLLDEPTVHLDINHQIEVLELIEKLNRDNGLTVLATMHDLNLAALYFGRLVLLNEGRIVTQGTAREVLSKERVENVFGTPVMVEMHPTRADAPHIVLMPGNGNGKDRSQARESKK
jgi:cobalamin transport system ATP-binding protein